MVSKNARCPEFCQYAVGVIVWPQIVERSAFLLNRGHYFLREMPPGCPPLEPETKQGSYNRTESQGVKKRKRRVLAGLGEPVSNAV